MNFQSYIGLPTSIQNTLGRRRPRQWSFWANSILPTPHAITFTPGGSVGEFNANDIQTVIALLRVH